MLTEIHKHISTDLPHINIDNMRHSLKLSLSSFSSDLYLREKIMAQYIAHQDVVLEHRFDRLWIRTITKMKHSQLPKVVQWCVRKCLGLLVRASNIFLKPVKTTAEKLMLIDQVIINQLLEINTRLSQRIGDISQRIGEIEKKIHYYPDPVISGETYLEFENIYRGSVGHVLNTQSHYFPFLKEEKTWDKGDEILDIGCGRGEFLKAAQNELGCRILGIDVNPKLENLLREQDIPFECSDVLVFLEKIENRFSLISAIHLIEHLPKMKLPIFLQACVRALKPGGYLILEWPNVAHLSVSGDTFELDPTHVARPHPLYVKTLLGWVGMHVVKDLDLSPHEDFKAWEHEPKESREYKLAYKIFGSQDKVLIAKKTES